jgi:hypothetical protein
MVGEGGFSPPFTETKIPTTEAETTNPVQKLEQNFVEGFAAVLSRNPDYPSTPQDYIKRHRKGLSQAYGAVAPKDGPFLTGSDADDPQNYVFRFGAGELSQDDLEKLNVPLYMWSRAANRERPLSALNQDPNRVDFQYTIDNGVTLHIWVKGEPDGKSPSAFNSVVVENCVAEVPLVRPPAKDGQPDYEGLTGEDLLEEALYRATPTERELPRLRPGVEKAVLSVAKILLPAVMSENYVEKATRTAGKGRRKYLLGLNMAGAVWEFLGPAEALAWSVALSETPDAGKAVGAYAVGRALSLTTESIARLYAKSRAKAMTE